MVRAFSLWTKEETDRIALQEKLVAATEMAEREREINRQIMQRKQEIEWQLMDALSQVLIWHAYSFRSSSL